MLKWRNSGGLRRIDRASLLLIAASAFTLALAGCSLLGKHPAAPASTVQPADSTASPGPEAKIQISYSQPNDFLSTLALTKYSGTSLLATEPAGSKGSASVLRFEGGVPIWQIDVEPGMFSAMPIGFSTKNYAVSEVTFGNVPPHFVQTTPDTGPPEPLEPDHFYIFSVTRKSGSISYDAVKVNADGSLQAYEADPRAGTSFRLCCNVSSDFAESAPASASDSSSPDTTSPDTSPPPADAPGP